MQKKDKKKKKKGKWTAEKSEEAMIEGILEGSPEGIGVAVIRLQCGCRKMAAVDIKGEPASEVLVYRDKAESVCDLCKKDDGAFQRVQAQFIHWVQPEPAKEIKKMIIAKALGIAI